VEEAITLKSLQETQAFRQLCEVQEISNAQTITLKSNVKRM